MLDEDGEADSEDQLVNAVVGAIIFSWALGVICRNVIKGALPIAVPYTGILLIFGIIIGALLVFAGDAVETDFTYFLLHVVDVNPEIMFFAVFCIPVFNTALHLDVNMLLRELGHVLILSQLGAVMSTIFIALFAHYIMPYDFDWMTSLYFGAICSATDTVAVVSKLKEKGTRSRLYILVEAEALLNNSAMIILFSAFFNSSVDIQSDEPPFILLQILRLSLGGVLLGFLVGALTSYIIGYILEDHLSELTVTIISCFSAFLISNATGLHVSSITAVITCGLYMSVYCIPRISVPIQKPLCELWGLMSFLSRTLVFFIAGLTMFEKVYGENIYISIKKSDWFYLFLLYVWVYLSRAMSILLCYPLLRMTAVADTINFETNVKHLAALWWCGVRGILALTLATIVGLNLLNEDGVGSIILFHTCGLVALSLLINGSTVEFALRLIGLDKNEGDEISNEVFSRACTAVELKLDSVVQELKKDRFLGDSDWSIVWRYIPVMTSATYWNRVRYGKIKLANGEENFNTSQEESHLSNSFFRRLIYNMFFVRAAADLAIARQFGHLPPRLRDVWQHYHRIYGKEREVSFSLRGEDFEAILENNVNSDVGNEQYQSLDGTMHFSPNQKVNADIHDLSKEFQNRTLDDSHKSLAGRPDIEDTSENRELRTETSKKVPGILYSPTPDKSNRVSLVSHTLGPHPDAVLQELRTLKEDTMLSKDKLQQIENRLRTAERLADKFMSDRRPSLGQKLNKKYDVFDGKIGLRQDFFQDNTNLNYFMDMGEHAEIKQASPQAKQNVHQLSEVRLRFITAVKANYVINYKNGWLTTSGLQVLLDNADEQLDQGHDDEPLREWNRLQVSFTLPDYQIAVASALRHTPFLGQIVGGWVFEKLAFVFMLAKNFILAHENIDILDVLPEGMATEQLALENAMQLEEATLSLKSQLLAFPEVARSLKTQVSARFLLHKHKEFVQELISGGFMNDWEGESLLHQNAVSHTLLHDHPYADHLPPRSVILSKVPFLRHLSFDDLLRIVEDESCCSEQYHGSNVVLIRSGEKSQGASKVLGTGGWYYIVHGTVHMVSETEAKGRREQVLHAGAVFGMTDEMLGRPYRGTYSTASFVHLIFFDKQKLLDIALHNDDLNKGIWRTVAVTVLRKFIEFSRMRLNELHKLIYSSEFVDLSKDGVGEVTNEAALRVEQIRSRLRKSYNGASMINSPEPQNDDGTIHIKRMTRDPSGNNLKQALKQMGLFEDEGEVIESGMTPPKMQGLYKAISSMLKIVEIDNSCYALILTGQLLPRPATELLPGVEGQSSPCLLTNVEGRFVLSSDAKLFLIPVSAVNKFRRKDPMNFDRNTPKGLKDHAIHRARGIDPASLSISKPKNHHNSKYPHSETINHSSSDLPPLYSKYAGSDQSKVWEMPAIQEK